MSIISQTPSQASSKNSSTPGVTVNLSRRRAEVGGKCTNLYCFRTIMVCIRVLSPSLQEESVEQDRFLSYLLVRKIRRLPRTPVFAINSCYLPRVLPKTCCHVRRSVTCYMNCSGTHTRQVILVKPFLRTKQKNSRRRSQLTHSPCFWFEPIFFHR